MRGVGLKISWWTKERSWSKLRPFKCKDRVERNIALVLRYLNQTSRSTRGSQKEKWRSIKNQRHAKSNFYYERNSIKRNQNIMNRGWLNGTIIISFNEENWVGEKCS